MFGNRRGRLCRCKGWHRRGNVFHSFPRHDLRFISWCYRGTNRPREGPFRDRSFRRLTWSPWRLDEKFARLDIEDRGVAKGHGASGCQVSDPLIELGGLLGIIRIWILQQNLDGFPQLTDCREFVTFFLIYIGQPFKERNATRSRREIFLQQRFRKPIILTTDRLVCQRFEGLSRRDQTSQPKMERGEQPPRFRVLRIEGEQFFQSSGRPAVLAGIHVGDGFFEKRALLTVPDDTLLVGPGRGLLIRLMRGFLVGPHALTLADGLEWQTRSHGRFWPLPLFQMISEGLQRGNWTQKCNPDAI